MAAETKTEQVETKQHKSSAELQRWPELLVVIGLLISGFAYTNLVLIPELAKNQSYTSHPAETSKQKPTNQAARIEGEVDEDKAAEDAEETNGLQSLVDEFAEKQPAQFYIYAKNLKTGETAKLKAGKTVPSGSIYKLFLANQVYRLNEAGKLDVNQYVGGTGYTISGCTMQMVQNSLNACGIAVRDFLGAKKHTKKLHKQGYKCTYLKKDGAAHTCAQDVALLLERLYEGGYFSKAHTKQFLTYLKLQKYRFRIPTGIPLEPRLKNIAGTRNKTGDVYAYTNDSAIVLGENADFILVSLSGPWGKPFPDSSIAHRHLAGLVYNHVNDTDYPLPYESY